MSTGSVAQEPTAQQQRWQQIRQRATRGLLLFNGGGVVHLEGDRWAVPARQGGSYLVDLDAETCPCEDFGYFGYEHDVSCKHLIAAALASAKRRNPRPHACVGGQVFVGHLVDGVEHYAAYPCRRCQAAH